LTTALEGCITGEALWLDHPGYGGYAVSNLGRVRTPKGRLARGVSNGEGYLRIQMPDRKRRVHHLQLEAFIGPCPAGMCGLHWDDVPGNNLLTNIRWDTPGANSADAWRNFRTRWQQNQHGAIICSEEGCRFTARTNRPGARCEMHYRAYRHRVAQRAMELSVRIG
jgi:hypothetical protein